MDLCTPADVHSFGLPRGAAPNPARPVVVDAVSDTFVLDQHGQALGDPIKLRPDAGGEAPEPLVQGVTYYCVPLDESTFQLAATPTGAAIDLITPGRRVLVICKSPVAAAITFVSRMLEDGMPGHVVPFTDPVPDIVRMTCAELAGARVMALSGTQSVAFGSLLDQAKKRLEKWAIGVPVRDVRATPPANLASAVSVPRLDLRGWGRYGGP